MNGAITGILLAAGEGRRFGGDKLVQPLADGTPMAVAAARALRAAVPRAVAVVGQADGVLARWLRAQGLEIVVNTRARDGMGTSIASGVAATPGAAGWIIALADMPFIPAAVIRQVAASLEAGGGIVAPACNGRRGHPVGFAAQYAGALRRLRGEAGARGIIRAHREALLSIEVDEAGVLVDIDTPQGIESARARCVPTG